MNDEYLCLTIVSNPQESDSVFKTRISEFWSSIVRGKPELFERVYAETTQFEQEGNTLTRKYLVEADAANEVGESMTSFGFAMHAIDPDDLYTKYEATPPEWFWIEH